MRGVEVSLDASKDTDAYASWRSRMAPIWEIRVPNERTFWITGTTWQFPHSFLNRVAGSAQIMLRTKELIAARPLDHVQLFRLDKGHVAADYDGCAVDLRSGDFVFVDYMRPIASKAGAFAASSLLLSREAVSGRFHGGDLHGTVVKADTQAGRMLGRYLDAVVAFVPTMTLDQAEPALTAFVALAAAVWPEPTPASSMPGTGLFDRATALIAAGVGDAKLSPASIAHALGISRTHLYTLFVRHGGVSATMLRVRLDASLKWLVAERNAPGLVGETAGRFGFKSVAHFSRAFSDRFGRSPRQVATLSAEHVGGLKYSAWLDAQSGLVSSEMIIGWLEAADVEQAEGRQRP